MNLTVLLLGTFDTKGEEYALVRSLLLQRGCQVLTMDLGILGAQVPPFPVDLDAARVAAAGGTPLEVLRARGDRGSAVQVMQRGAQSLAEHSKGRVDVADRAVRQRIVHEAYALEERRPFPEPDVAPRGQIEVIGLAACEVFGGWLNHGPRGPEFAPNCKGQGLLAPV